MNKSISSGRYNSMNKYLVVGDKDPNDMILPIVIDVKDLEAFIQHFISKILPDKKIKIRRNKSGNLEILEDEPKI